MKLALAALLLCASSFAIEIDLAQLPTPVVAAKPGAPALPETGRLIAIPNGYRAEITRVEETTEEVANVEVEPVQSKSRCDCERAPFAFNRAIYAGHGLYPEAVAAIEPVGKLQELRIARVALHPVRWDRDRHRLRLSKTLRVSVALVPDGTRLSSAHLTPLFARIAREVTANGRDLSRASLGTTPERLVIVVADGLRDTVVPLARWKAQRGLDVRIVTLSEAGGSKEAVRDHLQRLPRASYLLFVGNATTMPPFVEKVPSYPSADTGVSDYPYATMEGGVIPDASYGRILADDAAEATRQVSRIIDYEKNLRSDATWLDQATTIASDGVPPTGPSDVQYAEMIQSTLKMHGYRQVDGFYEADHTATGTNLSGALTSGRSWITYLGHGNGRGWSSTNWDDPFYIDQVRVLTNADRLPVIVDVACLNAGYVTTPHGFGRAWVNQQSGGKAAGAVAFFGSSIKAPWHEPATMAVEIAKAHYDRGIHELGGMLLAGEMQMIARMGITEDTMKVLKWYDLLGDPSLQMRTASPGTLEVTHAMDKTAVSVKARDRAGQGLGGLRVSLTAPDQTVPYAVARTSTTGEASLVVKTPIAKGTLLTVTGYNEVAYQSALE